VHTLDQVVAQAARLGWTVGITSEDLVGAQCRAVVGLGSVWQKTRNSAPASTWSECGTARPRTRARTSGGHGVRVRRPLRGARGGAAGEWTARPA
jgi:hypothetical protein